MNEVISFPNRGKNGRAESDAQISRLGVIVNEIIHERPNARQCAYCPSERVKISRAINAKNIRELGIMMFEVVCDDCGKIDRPSIEESRLLLLLRYS